MSKKADVFVDPRTGEEVPVDKVSRRLALMARSYGDVEKLDQTPVALMETRLRKPPTIRELIQAYVRSEVSAVAQSEGLGSFEDEDDFELDDEDADLLSEFQKKLMQEEFEEVTLDGRDSETAVDNRSEGSASGVRGGDADAERPRIGEPQGDAGDNGSPGGGE